MSRDPAFVCALDRGGAITGEGSVTERSHGTLMQLLHLKCGIAAIPTYISQEKFAGGDGHERALLFSRTP